MKNYKKISIVTLALCAFMLVTLVVCAQDNTPPDKNTLKNEIKTTSNSANKNKETKKETTTHEDTSLKSSYNHWDTISSFINTFSTAILALLTLVYVILTFRILSEMRAAKEPAIEIDFEVKVNTLHETFVWVKNAGLSPAKNIQIDVDDKLPLFHLYELKNTTLSETNFIKNGIPYLAPGRSKTYAVGNLKLNRDRWKSDSYIVKFSVDFENMKSKKHNLKMTVNVLQCIDPVVFRGQETMGAEYQVRPEKKP